MSGETRTAGIKKITIVNGSNKGEKGNTQILVDLFAEGAGEAGAEVQTFFLRKKTVKPCLSCYNCWVKTPGKCVINDDMTEMLQTYIESDLAVFATPIYADNVSGIMKMFLDRVVPLVDPHFVKDGDGETRHVRRYDKYPGFVIISTAGYPEQSQFQVISHYFNRLARNAFTEVLGEIYRGGGALLAMPEGTPIYPIVEAYKKLVVKAGREIVENGRLSDATRAELDKPLIPHDLFISEGNKMWDKAIADAAAKSAAKESAQDA